MEWERTLGSAADRAALGNDLKAMALAHAALDELGVPRTRDGGVRLTLFGRIEALRAGKYDPEKLTAPGGAASNPCPTCGLLARFGVERGTP